MNVRGLNNYAKTIFYLTQRMGKRNAMRKTEKRAGECKGKATPCTR